MEKSNVERYAEELCSENKKLKSEIDEKNCQIAEMQHHIDCLEADKSELRTRCKESATDSFDKHLYGLLNIVGREDLETHAVDLPTEPIKVAEMLIDAIGTYKTNNMERAFGAGDTGIYEIYSVSNLRQIAEHLLVYCNANSEE